MSDIIAAPLSIGLPYASIFSVPKKDAFKRPASDYYWQKATAPPNPNSDAHLSMASDQSWLENPDASDWIDIENEEASQTPPSGLAPQKTKKRSAFRHISFLGFVTKPGSTKSNIVTTTEGASHHLLSNKHPLFKKYRSSEFTVYKGWRIRSMGRNAKVKKLVAVVRRRISSNSPEEQKPKTWEEYSELYSSEQIDVNDPPLPPMEPNADHPTPYEEKKYNPGFAVDEQARQLIIRRLAVCGKGGYDSSEAAVARARERTKLAAQLEEEGKEPKSLAEACSDISDSTTMRSDSTTTKTSCVPETLEQHPIFRKIVKQCRDMFGTAHCLISIMQEETQIFLAVSEGSGDGREAPRDYSMCTHTVLSGRKGFVILDAQKDWRFSLGPLCQYWGTRFYAGVPLLSPRLGSEENASYPIGTLCIIDTKPWDSFGVEQRKKLVYMAEYARQEIELWFMDKISQKVEGLEQSRKDWRLEAEQIASIEEVTTNIPIQVTAPLSPVEERIESIPTAPTSAAPRKKPSFIRFTNHLSDVIPDNLSPRKARSFTGFKISDSEVSTPSSSPYNSPLNSPIKKRSFAGFRSFYSEASTPTTASSACHPIDGSTPTTASSACHPIHGSTRASELPSIFDRPESAIKPNLKRILDLATQAVGDTLDLSLVYLLAVEAHPHSLDTGRSFLVSSYNLPSPMPHFDAALHLGVLRAPEGGLLYQNQAFAEVRTTELDPKPETGLGNFASALLVPVGAEKNVSWRGFVLAGFTDDVNRVFGGEDETYMKQFATELSRFTSRLQL